MLNLAAQAGVRYSLENPAAYIQSNLVGFGHILVACRRYGVENLVYASSRSVYGGSAASGLQHRQQLADGAFALHLSDGTGPWPRGDQGFPVDSAW